MRLFKKELTPAEVVKRSREDRFDSRELINGIFTDFFELHGDRLSADDPSIIGGLAMLGEQPVTVIATNKGKNLDEKLTTHNGSPEPSGYRKALRLMQAAAKFNRPIITFINTPGAYPGKAAEENGQGAAIAQDILTSMKLPVPIIAIIFGEGGSGGALALATADQVWMVDNSTYSILSPEGFASILWKDSKRADEAAEVMGLTAKDLLAAGVIDYIIPDSRSKRVFQLLRARLNREIGQLQTLAPSTLLKQRHARFRKF
ncbi:carboxyltransferase subunit alpha [Weissella halotolerans]|uniref:acetyl-CoA carboxytransferase n=1 Tax=Weissella halotolerans DSM 20190 TaxID=1123500 RepID=A0A0R2G9B7_9LACO|nr:carboxyltransferase subunit alpha [Weissella halotolerans]KRN33268.1 Acetyl-CoA carboxylase alpha subunit [Weissella halotolerans DSM 20190]